MSLLIIHAAQVSIESFRRLFAQSGCRLTTCPNSTIAKSLLARHEFKGVFVLYPASLEAVLQTQEELKEYSVPIFVVSKRQSAVERVNALQAGVKNYYIEPFSYTQIVQDAIDVVYRPSLKSDIRQYNDVKVDFLTRMVKCQEMDLFLSKIQFLLFTFLIQNERQVFSRVQIWEHVWGYADYPISNTIDAQIRRLRTKLPLAIGKRIEAVHGIGYRYIISD